jgi:hypothetical protein
MLQLKKNFDTSVRIDLHPIGSSSQDYNQSIHRTLNLYDDNQFWSSTGSEDPEKVEWLEYKLEKPAAIRKMSLKNFNP